MVSVTLNPIYWDEESQERIYGGFFASLRMTERKKVLKTEQKEVKT